MSVPPPRTTQPHQNGPVEDDLSTNQNAPVGSNLSATDFGSLYHEVREHVGRLEAGIDLTNNAILNLAKVFREHVEMIHIVGERWDKDQTLEKEIQRLKAANKEMWQLRHEDVEQHKIRISELTEAAEAGQKQKQKYEWKTTQLKDHYRQKQQSMKRELEEARDGDRKALEQKKT
jgi:hypothetical protein